MKRVFETFVGIDLGGARGKTTAVAILSTDGDQAVVHNVTPRRLVGADETPWSDEALLELIAEHPDACVAIDAPLTAAACVRCVRPVCPGQQACEDTATMWLESRGAELVRIALAADDRIAVTSNATVGFSTETQSPTPTGLVPYVHRCTEVELHYGRGVFPKERLGQSPGPVANRALHLVKRLEAIGFALNDNLVEVSPRATVWSLAGEDLARGYKRDADPWQTRATILESIGVELRFAAKSRFSREQCLANDNCFDALLSAFSAYLCAQRGVEMPDGPFAEDGWIWVP